MLSAKETIQKSYLQAKEDLGTLDIVDQINLESYSMIEKFQKKPKKTYPVLEALMMCLIGLAVMIFLVWLYIKMML